MGPGGCKQWADQGIRGRRVWCGDIERVRVEVSEGRRVGEPVADEELDGYRIRAGIDPP